MEPNEKYRLLKLTPVTKIKWSEVSKELCQKFEPHIFKDIFGEDELPILTEEELEMLGNIDFYQ